jgi:L-malate glycosyltransferase
MDPIDQKIRIAIIIPRLEALGPVIVIQNLVNSLPVTGSLSVKVFYMDKKIDKNLFLSVPVENLDPQKFIYTDFDIIHTNGIRPDLFGYLNRGKIKYHISTLHNFVFEDLEYTYNKLVSCLIGNLWLLLWKRADKLICISNSMKTYYSKWFSSSKLEVIHNGIIETDKDLLPDNDVNQSIIDFKSRGLKVVGCAGILTRRKGFDQILHLVASDHSMATVIIGDGRELTHLKHLSESLDISDRCEFCGFRNNAVVYFKYFDLFIMPSKSEGFGLALIEAVQQNIPVICSDIAVFKELFNDNEVTFFKLGDQRSLAAAIKVVSETGHKKTGPAYTKYVNHYKAEIMAGKYYELYGSA